MRTQRFLSRLAVLSLWAMPGPLLAQPLASEHFGRVDPDVGSLEVPPIAPDEAAASGAPNDAPQPVETSPPPGATQDASPVEPSSPEAGELHLPPVPAATGRSALAAPLRSARLAPEQEHRPIAGGAEPVSATRDLIRTGAALGVVLAAIVAMAWVIRRTSRGSGSLAAAIGPGGRAPSGLLEVLGRYPIGSRQTLVVLKFDRRVLLLGQTSGGRGAPVRIATLCEIDDPDDVASVLLKARDERNESISRRFEDTLRGAGAFAESVERAATTLGPQQAGPGGPEASPSVHTRRVSYENPAPARPERAGAAGQPAGGSEDPVGALRQRLETLRSGRP